MNLMHLPSQISKSEMNLQPRVSLGCQLGCILTCFDWQLLTWMLCKLAGEFWLSPFVEALQGWAQIPGVQHNGTKQCKAGSDRFGRKCFCKSYQKCCECHCEQQTELVECFAFWRLQTLPFLLQHLIILQSPFGCPLCPEQHQCMHAKESHSKDH